MVVFRGRVLRSGLGGVLAVLVALGANAAAAQAPLNTDQLRALLEKERPAVFLLDVRTPGEWADGHMGGAVFIPMNQIPGRLGEIPKDKKIVVVCASGARSAAVARYLDQQGYPWVANYGGGVSEWHRRGLPLER
jgi:rhodanese-related sulfurtransferase